MRPLALALVATLAALAAIPAPAATVAGVSLPDTTRVGDTTLVLNGAAVRSKLMFKVYVGALYLGSKQSDAQSVLAADAPRRMRLHFLRGVSGGQMCDSWKEGLTANTPGGGAELAADFERLCAYMEDVADGSIISLTYVPGTGTEIAVDGRAKGTIAGKAFADAVLACWIGPEPGPGEDFKKGVLGG